MNIRPPQNIRVVNAQHVGGLRLRITYSDGYVNEVDFAPFFSAYPHPQYNKYSKEKEFKRFILKYDNVVWGRDTDLILPVRALYCNDFDITDDF